MILCCNFYELKFKFLSLNGVSINNRNENVKGTCDVFLIDPIIYALKARQIHTGILYLIINKKDNIIILFLKNYKFS